MRPDFQLQSWYPIVPVVDSLVAYLFLLVFPGLWQHQEDPFVPVALLLLCSPKSWRHFFVRVAGFLLIIISTLLLHSLMVLDSCILLVLASLHGFYSHHRCCLANEGVFQSFQSNPESSPTINMIVPVACNPVLFQRVQECQLSIVRTISTQKMSNNRVTEVCHIDNHFESKFDTLQQNVKKACSFFYKRFSYSVVIPPSSDR